MKVLLFTLEYAPFNGGIANYYKNLVKYWLEPDNIFVLNNNNNELISRNFPVLKWSPAFLKLRKEIKKNKISHVLVGHILPLGIVAYFLSKILKFKYSVILHGMDFSFAIRTRRKRLIVKKILKNSDSIICANKYTADMINLFLKKDIGNIIIVNPGIEINATRNMKNITQLENKYNLDKKIVLFSLGRLVKRKGFDKVIKAMPIIIKKIPNLIYFIAGAGPDKEYLERCKNNLEDKFIKNHIIFLGKISDEEKKAWLNICDIFIMPSRDIDGDFEGFGIVYLEANMAGKPVIAGDSGGVQDAVVNRLNGLIVNSQSVENIAESVIKLSLDKELRKKLGEQGKERVIKNFHRKNQSEKIYNIINRII